ncbi:hypothetical protein RvY_02882 [Ramazzottius varieornatus]|uniref:Uncharacterized protein n=1 Tax=Ramazzottius varieornatus TaxID=947166 RepID=A0A1D1UL94_RAMVA|nr:hypothetical protein RvY_02882 [Ramazzottius varieornatus]
MPGGAYVAYAVHDVSYVQLPHPTYTIVVQELDEVAEKYFSNTDLGAAAPPLPPSVVVNPADMVIDESENETEESDTSEEFDDRDDTDLFAGQG